VKKADKKQSFIININFNKYIFNDNKVSSAGKKIFSIPALLLLLFCVGALVVLHCCPKILPDYIRYFVSVVEGI